MLIIIIIIIPRMIFMVLSSWHSHCESSPHSFDECRLSAEVATNPQTKPTYLDCESARKKWQLSSTFTIAILLLLSPRADTRPTKSGRLSRPRHCSKGVQPVPKAVYRNGRRVKHNCRRWDSNLGPLTLQSGMLPLGHCDTVNHVAGVQRWCIQVDVEQKLM